MWSWGFFFFFIGSLFIIVSISELIIGLFVLISFKELLDFCLNFIIHPRVIQEQVVQFPSSSVV